MSATDASLLKNGGQMIPQVYDDASDSYKAMPGDGDGHPEMVAGTTSLTTMQSAATATGVGTTLTVTGYGTAMLQITGTFVGTITFGVSGDGTNYEGIYGENSETGTRSLTATAPGIYFFSLPAAQILKAEITAYTSGNITVKGRAIGLSVPSGNVTVSGSSIGYAPSASQTRPNNTTAYANNDVVGEDPAANLTFSNVLGNAGGGFIIYGVTLRVDVAAVPAGMQEFRLHLYSSAPTAIADNTAFDLPSGDRAKYLGYITLDEVKDLGSTLIVQQSANVPRTFSGKLASASTSLYGILETVYGYTPTASAVKTVTLFVAGV